MSDKELIKNLLSSYENRASDPKISFDKALFYSFLSDVKKLLVLDYLSPVFTYETVVSLTEKVRERLSTILNDFKVENADEKLEYFLSSLPQTREILLSSAEAILEGDPASESIQEIILCYPGFSAISNYRIGHLLYQMDLKFLARLATEDAHRSTGIDINPGATIGEYFFIDHGTGIVIGETCVIGKNVKLYQGVTLGALSLSRGRCLKGEKRHPTIEDNCTIYSCATILGGDTIIGENTTIGANTHILHSIPKHSKVYQSKDELIIVPKDKKSE